MGRAENSDPRDFNENEIQCIEALLRGMLTCEPSQRMTAQGAVASD